MTNNVLISYLKLMRPYQWVKNLFCFSGAVFGFHFTEYHLIIDAALVFVAFCLASGAVYVLNDIFDVDADRDHPKKKNRPIASGQISMKKAWFFYGLLVLLSSLFAIKLGLLCLIIIWAYIVINIYYSVSGKHIVLLDVFIISFGFVLRILAGTAAIGIPSSEWLLLCGVTLTLFLGFAKRRAELLSCEKLNITVSVKRRVLEHYEPRMLDIFVGSTATAAIISYSLFVIIGKDIPNILYTVIFVIYGIFRYIYLLYSHESRGQDTANDLLDDKHLIVTVTLWLVTYIGLVLYK